MIHRKRGLLYPLLPSRSYAGARIETWLCRAAVSALYIAFLCGRADWNTLISPSKEGAENRVPMWTRGLKWKIYAQWYRWTISRSLRSAWILVRGSLWGAIPLPLSFFRCIFPVFLTCGHCSIIGEPLPIRWYGSDRYSSDQVEFWFMGDWRTYAPSYRGLWGACNISLVDVGCRCGVA